MSGSIWETFATAKAFQAKGCEGVYSFTVFHDKGFVVSLIVVNLCLTGMLLTWHVPCQNQGAFLGTSEAFQAKGREGICSFTVSYDNGVPCFVVCL